MILSGFFVASFLTFGGGSALAGDQAEKAQRRFVDEKIAFCFVTYPFTNSGTGPPPLWLKKTERLNTGSANLEAVSRSEARRRLGGSEWPAHVAMPRFSTGKTQMSSVGDLLRDPQSASAAVAAPPESPAPRTPARGPGVRPPLTSGPSLKDLMDREHGHEQLRRLSGCEVHG